MSAASQVSASPPRRRSVQAAQLAPERHGRYAELLELRVPQAAAYASTPCAEAFESMPSRSRSMPKPSMFFETYLGHVAGRGAFTVVDGHRLEAVFPGARFIAVLRQRVFAHDGFYALCLFPPT